MSTNFVVAFESCSNTFSFCLNFALKSNQNKVNFTESLHKYQTKQQHSVRIRSDRKTEIGGGKVERERQSASKLCRESHKQRANKKRKHTHIEYMYV